MFHFQILKVLYISLRALEHASGRGGKERVQENAGGVGGGVRVGTRGLGRAGERTGAF